MNIDGTMFLYICAYARATLFKLILKNGENLMQGSWILLKCSPHHVEDIKHA